MGHDSVYKSPTLLKTLQKNTQMWHQQCIFSTNRGGGGGGGVVHHLTLVRGQGPDLLTAFIRGLSPWMGFTLNLCPFCVVQVNTGEGGTPISLQGPGTKSDRRGPFQVSRSPGTGTDAALVCCNLAFSRGSYFRI